MAAKRITKSAINWVELAERVPANQKSNFASFKTKSNAYLQRMLANPESPPKLNWAFYKEKIAIAGMVDNFQKSYESLKIPYPEDKYTPALNEYEKQVKADIAQFIQESNQRISEYQKEINKLRSLVPYSEMTLEEFRDAFPDKALDPLNKPTYWPHTPEEQIGFKTPEAAAAESKH